MNVEERSAAVLEVAAPTVNDKPVLNWILNFVLVASVTMILLFLFS
jgi:hypothetical protein